MDNSDTTISENVRYFMYKFIRLNMMIGLMIFLIYVTELIIKLKYYTVG